MSTASANAVLVEALGSSLRRGGNALEDVPALVKRVLREEAWREYVTPRGEVIQHDRFADFITTPPTAGLGASVDLVRRIVLPDPEALDLLDQAIVGRQGERTDLVSNRNEVPRPVGTTKAAALRKLRKDKPELHADVLAGRLSAHAAMIQAGFRPKTVSVPVDRPETVARTLRKNLAPEDLAELVRLLSEKQ
ncbi:hypothetical protein JL475_32730 [Streptomyces sp. M2CJ-2]|uniref:hypothetical protein n=1 Tax=Streptomyces sp. M2CJ-2 TaxID=2803948 RepID=UPI0019274919|nr:hypothetical protein [Streptomyces sp. M2CJ-2]MBL3670653.1 hypothetical protein [Streptomyces sp. M2CJ-2]